MPFVCTLAKRSPPVAQRKPASGSLWQINVVESLDWVRCVALLRYLWRVHLHAAYPNTSLFASFKGKLHLVHAKYLTGKSLAGGTSQFFQCGCWYSFASVLFGLSCTNSEVAADVPNCLRGSVSLGCLTATRIFLYRDKKPGCITFHRLHFDSWLSFPFGLMMLFKSTSNIHLKDALIIS